MQNKIIVVFIVSISLISLSIYFLIPKSFSGGSSGGGGVSQKY
jgi:hypothetical protein